MREWSELALRVKVMREGVAVACGALAIVLGLRSRRPGENDRHDVS